MLKKTLTIVSLASAGFLPLAQADDHAQDDRWYVAPFATFVRTGGDRDSSDGWGGGMGIGKIINDHFNVELKGFHEEFSGNNGPWSLTGGTADVQYYFARDKFSPYTVVGLGGMNSCASANCGAGIIGEAGAGFTYELHDNFLLRSDVRYRYNNNFNAHVQPGTDEFHDMTVNVGFVIPFGDKPRAAEKYEAPIVQAAQPADCSTLDSDADGVNDCLDLCPGSIQGSHVDANGCLVSLVLKGVNFKYDSAELTVNAKSILDEVADSLIAHPQKNDIEVQGHASSEGADDYNMRLSQRRSASVVEYLQAKGVANRLIARGYGETRPVADNSTEAGRAENRRIELIWLNN
ncbi:MAG: OmpA family protein [Methylobacter sp.]|nr:OmpA family protein [Methylobacter sp.]MDP2099944.1 OmpA family protein [Methylobacter sp.]MDP2427004.1 OmpA family protein [Methylobacter sp.]MDP3054300.1 OmpA family protein [Methylobacter sp.]MDP3363005.1 OmpA family protein [Methylobacter sp.]